MTIIEIAARDSPGKAIILLAWLFKEASTDIRRSIETVKSSIERFTLIAQSNLNLTYADQTTPKSHSSALTFLYTANLSPKRFSSVIALPASLSKYSSKILVTSAMLIESQIYKKVIKIISTLASDEMNGEDLTTADECAHQMEFTMRQ